MRISSLAARNQNQITKPLRWVVTLCTYNERENLADLIAEIHQFAPDVDVLVIDDHSPDGTGEIADKIAAANPQIFVLHRSGKLGLGSATLAGFRWAVEHGYDWLINMDADFSHHPRHLPELRTLTDDADVIIGSRYVAGGRIQGWGLLRHFMSRGINWYARLLLRLPAYDNSGSYRCYRIAKLDDIEFEQVRSTGYAFQEEMLYRCRKVGCQLRETPITFADRQKGASKMRFLDALQAMWDILCVATEKPSRSVARK